MTRPGPASRTRLQWGHALMAWKTTDAGPDRDAEHDASMGPRFNGVEDAWGRRVRPRRSPGFNGATL